MLIECRIKFKVNLNFFHFNIKIHNNLKKINRISKEKLLISL